MQTRGFTLVEAVMVIVLTTILTAAAIGGLRGTQTWRASAAIRRVQSDLLYARSAALLSGRRTLWVFDANQNSYELQQEASQATGAIAGVALENPVTGTTWHVALNDLATGLTISFSPALNPAEIGFDNAGMPVNRAGAALTTDITMTLGSTSQLYFDVSEPLPPERFYRVWQSGAPSVAPSLYLPYFVPAITLTGSVGDSLRLDYINAIGPTDAWVTLDTVTLTNSSQLYFDVSSIGQPGRLYRIVPVP